MRQKKHVGDNERPWDEADVAKLPSNSPGEFVTYLPRVIGMQLNFE